MTGEILIYIYTFIQSLVPFFIKRFINRLLLNIYNKNIYVSHTNFFQLWDIINKKIQIGEKTFIGRWWKFFARDNLIKIGKYCAIAWNVFMITYNHPTEYITWHINRPRKIIELNHDIKKWDIIIWNDVWIGQNVIILPGVKIWNGAVVWAWAVVTKDIPSYAIVGWNPAKIIKYRFSEKWIQYVEWLKWWDWNKEKIQKNEKLFNVKVDEIKGND